MQKIIKNKIRSIYEQLHSLNTKATEETKEIKVQISTHKQKLTLSTLKIKLG